MKCTKSSVLCQQTTKGFAELLQSFIHLYHKVFESSTITFVQDAFYNKYKPPFYHYTF